jgi:hypothetical protein
MSTVLRAAGLGKKCRRTWALSDCTLDLGLRPRTRTRDPWRSGSLASPTTATGSG